MSLCRCGWLLSVLVILLLGGVAASQEPATETETEPAGEKDYHDLRRSKNRTIQRFAERFSYLVRTQEWTSANGKSKVMARYVSHTPDLKQVTLAVAKGSGANRATREVTVQVGQLDRTCQSRVKQIDTIKKKLDELAAKEEEEENAQPGAEASAYGEYGAPMTDERGAEPAETEEAAGADSATSERGANQSGRYSAYSSAPPTGEASPTSGESTPPTPAPGASDPDPLGFGEIANETPPVDAADGSVPQSATSRPYGRYSSGPPADPAGGFATGEPGRIDPSQWKTSYPAFQANFTTTPSDGREPTIDWGQLTELKSMHDTFVANQERGINNEYGQATADASQQLGDVSWEAVFLGMTQSETGEQELQFDLPALPEPLKIRFVPVDSPETWATMRPGQPLKFFGRLDVNQPQEILVRVRMAQ
jgi:hypothetical protein